MGVTAKEAYEKHMHQIQHSPPCDSYTAQHGRESRTLRHLKMLHSLEKNHIEYVGNINTERPLEKKA